MTAQLSMPRLLVPLASMRQAMPMLRTTVFSAPRNIPYSLLLRIRLVVTSNRSSRVELDVLTTSQLPTKTHSV